MNTIDVSSEYFKESAAVTFYHYTSPEALVSIIRGSSLRFTDCMFLNDAEEYNYVLSLIKEKSNVEGDFVSSFIKQLSDYNYGTSCVGMDNSDVYFVQCDKRLKPQLGNYYVLSGSTNRDSLPMWLYYVKGADYIGYSVKLNARKFSKHFSNIEGELLYGKVLYDEEKQWQLIYKFAEKLADSYNIRSFEDCKKLDDETCESVQDSFYDFIQRIRLFFKRSGYQHEKEFRLVVLTNDEAADSFGYFISKGIIKPYIEYKFENGIPIEEIMLSPSIEKGGGIAGLSKLIDSVKKDKYEKIKLCKSQLKLRF